MKTDKNSLQDTVTSRIVIMLFCLFALAILARVYIMPFQKHGYVINNYYLFIEYGTMLAAFVMCIFGFLRCRSVKEKQIDLSKKLFTPFMFEILAVCAFIASVAIPLSKNRTLAFKYTVFALVGVFVAYAVYYIVNRAFCVLALICTIYCMLFAYLDFMYSENITFTDKISITYTSFVLIFIGIIILCILCSLFISKKIPELKLFDVSLLSIIAIVALIVRLFVLRYVSVVVITLEILVFILLAVNYKFRFLNKK